MNDRDLHPPKPLSRADVPYGLALVVLVCLLYLPQYFSGQTAMDRPELMDVTTQWYPGYTIIGDMYRAGLFPVWNPTRYGGMPWVAYSHSAGLYPPNAVLLTAMHFLDAATFLHLFHCLLAALGLFILARELRLSAPASLLVALSFSCSGFFFYLQSQLSNHATIAWTPLFLYGLLRLGRGRRMAHFILVGLVAMMMVYGGDVEGLVYSLIFAALFLFVFLDRELSLSWWRLLFICGGAVCLGLFAGAAMELCLLELMGQSVRSSRSLFDLEFSGLFGSWYWYVPLALLPLGYFADLHPAAAFNNGLPPFYFGIFSLLGAAYGVGLYRGDRRVMAFLRIAALMAGLMALKKADFFSPVMDRIPVLGQLATAERSIEFIQLILLLAAGVSFDYFSVRAGKRSVSILAGVLLVWGIIACAAAGHQVLPWTRYLAGGLAGLAAAALLAFRAKEAIISRAVVPTLCLVVFFDIYVLALAATPRVPRADYELDPTVSGFLDGQDRSYRFAAFENLDAEDKPACLAGLVSAETGLDYPFGHMRLPTARYFEFLYLIDPEVAKDWEEVFLGVQSGRKLFFTADLYSPAFISNKNVHLLNLLGVKYIFSRGMSFKYSSPFSLMNEDGLVGGSWRNLAEPTAPVDLFRDRGRRAFTVNLPFLAVFESYVHAGTEFCVELKRPSSGSWPSGTWVTLAAREAGQEGGAFTAWTLPVSAEAGLEYPVRIDLSAVSGRHNEFSLRVDGARGSGTVTLVDARLARADAPFQRVAAGPVDVFVNRDALARAFVVGKALSLPASDIPEVLRSPNRFDPVHAVIFEAGDVPSKLLSLTGGSDFRGGGARMVRQGHQEVEVLARLSSPGWLVLADPYYPGWRARVDGHESRIYRADYVFRAVFLTDGESRVRFWYQPVSFRAGLWFTLTTLVCVLAVVVLGLAGAFKKVERG